MAQWGQGMQYPLQTGFNPQQQQQQFQPGLQPGGLLPQQTGYPGPRPAGFQQPQPTGFPGPQQPPQGGFGLQPGGFQPQQTGFQPQLQAQPTGFQPQSAFQRRAPPPPPPVPPIPSQFNQGGPPGSGFLGAPQGATRSFLSPSPGPLTAQPTGYGGGLQPLVPQVTGFVDPRLQMMSSTFLPANPSMPYTSAGAPLLQQPQGASLQQSFQQHNQQRGTAAPKIPWALSKAEKKSYDQIFRAWDTRGEGFITGQTALEVFGQSGLDKNDLAKIWALADADNRGKLNLPEFHVAMGIIYRRLNGNDIPDELPPELVPPSHRDLDSSVNFLKDILKNDTRARSPASFESGPVSKLPQRSFNSPSANAGGRQDATVYKYNDDTPAGGFYHSRSRHVDRAAIRTTSENNSPSSDLADLKRQLDSASNSLDATRDEESSRTAEDEELAREMDDLRYRVRRVQEDLEYNTKGPRSTAKEEERRRLERELMTLRHEKMPDLERRIEDREERKKREKREWDRERDKRNERFGRFGDRDRDEYSSSSRYGRDEYDRDRDRNYGSYDDRDRERDRDRDFDRDRPRERDDRDRERDFDRERDRDRPYSRNKERDYDRTRSPPAARSPPPAPPAAAPPTINRPPPSPAPAGRKKLTAEERAAEVQRRIQERMAALGVTPVANSSPKVDTAVEDRLAQERKEAEEKAKAAEREAEERERIRRERLQGEKALKDGPATPTTPVASAPAVPTPPVSAPAPPKPTPPPVKARAPAPPPPRKVPTIRSPLVGRTPPAPAPPVVAPAPPAPAPPPPAPVVPEFDPQEEEIRAREAAIRKAREERLARLKRLEQEEEEANRRLEEEYEARRRQFQSPPAPPAVSPAPPRAPPAPVAPPPPAAAPVAPAPPPPAPPAPVAPPPAAAAPPPPPPPPPAPPAPPMMSPQSAEKTSTNPFSRMMNQGSTPGSATTPSAANGSYNPFFKPQSAAAPSAPAPPTPSIPPPSKSPAPPAIRASYNTAPESESDWDDVEEKAEDSDSDDELNSSRDTRDKLARQLFGSILPPSRPQSVAPAQTAPSAPSTPAPPPPPPSAPPTVSVSAAPLAPPPPPMAPPAPPAPTAAIAAPAPTEDRNALLSAIQSGARLRKAVTHDRSAAAISGRVIGDASPPEQHYVPPPREPSPPPPAAQVPFQTPEMAPTNSNRESVGWFADLAANQTMNEPMPSMAEEAEEEHAAVPQIHVDAAQESDPLQDVDFSTEYHVRSLYAYEGQRAEDISFAENLILKANPSKSGGDWWYGVLVRDGKKGFFPKTYVERCEKATAKALYGYEGTNPDELPFAEGDELSIVDRADGDWWKAEQSGVVFIVPAAYLELVDASRDASKAPIPPLVVPVPEEPAAMRSPISPVSPEASSDMPDIVERELEEDTESETDSDDSYWATDEEDAFTSSDLEASEEGEDEELTEEQRRTEKEARAIERQRVFEAAGLIITKTDRKPPPRPARKKSTRKRRPVPAVPQRPAHKHDRTMDDLPPPPELDNRDSSFRLDDAYDRYEEFKKTNTTKNRLSMASVDTTVSADSSALSPSASLNILRTPSAEQDGRSYSHFLHFFSRRTPANDGEARVMPVISGPIPISDSNKDVSISSEGSDFGMSWASLIDKSALEGIPPTERRRQEAIFELIATEASYVRDLQLIVEVFYSGLLPILDQKAVTVIFANVEDILLTNTTFLSSLEERQKECRLYIDRIGDLLQANMSRMAVYTEYCINQSTASRVLQSLRQTNPELGSCLQRLRDEPSVRNLDLSSYLLVPMQRITRYPLLIKQILHYSEVAEERKEIEAAQEIAEKILRHINETIRELEGRERLRIISANLWIGEGRLDLTAPTRYMGQRKLLKEGVLLKSRSGRRLRAFLCSDILVLTDESTKTLYRMPIPLSEIQVKEVAGWRDDLAFQVALAYPRGGDKINLKASSARDCQVWMQALERASQRCREAEKRAAQRR